MKPGSGNEDLQKLGKKIRQLRVDKGLSQEDLADVCGFDRTYISLIERGKRNLSFTNLCAFARGLNVTVSVLVEGI